MRHYKQMRLDFCIPKGRVHFHEDVSLATTECCNLSDSAVKNTDSVCNVSNYMCTYEREDSAVLYFCCFEAERYCGDERQRHVYKQVFLSWKRKRGPFYTFSFLQILFPVLSFPFPTIFQFISVTYKEVIRQTVSLFSYILLHFLSATLLSLLPPSRS